MAAKKSKRPDPEALAEAKRRASEQLAAAAGCLTVQEVAKQCDVHPETVKRWIASEKLRAFKFGGHWRVRPEHVTEYLRVAGAA